MDRNRYNPKWEKYRDEFTEYYLSRSEYKNRLSRKRSYYDCVVPINQLYEYLKRTGVKDLKMVTEDVVANFQKYLYVQLMHRPGCIKRKYERLGIYFSYLVNKEYIPANPFNKSKYMTEADAPVKRIQRYYSTDELMERYSNMLRRINVGEPAQLMKNRDLKLFISYLYEHRDKTSLYKVTEEDLKLYKEYLKKYQYEPGRYYSPHNQIRAIVNVKQFYQRIRKMGYISDDPSASFDIVKYRKELEDHYKTSLTPPDPDRFIPPEIKTYRDTFLEYITFKGYSRATVLMFKKGINVFAGFLAAKNIVGVDRIDKAVIIEYQEYLKNGIRKKDGTHLGPAAIKQRLTQLLGFLRFLAKKEYMSSDYSAFIDMPKIGNPIPRTVMTEHEVDLVLRQPDVLTKVGLRDKVALEMLYSTAIRATELSNVKIDDVDLTGGLIRINVPKGGDDYQRVIPIGRIACHYIKKYIKSARQDLLRSRKEDRGYLILTYNGNKTSNNIINDIVKKHVLSSGIKKHVTPHSFRATCATLMLKNSADIRYVQEQLGHRSIRSTQIYTRLVPKDLKLIHTRCHPREMRGDVKQ